jgi:Flp pilus assembly protein TadD
LVRAFWGEVLLRDDDQREAHSASAFTTWVAALQCINKAVALAPNDAMCWDSRGEVYLGLGSVEEALFNFDHALSLAPHDRIVWANKARTLRVLGRAAEAEAAERRAAALGGL